MLRFTCALILVLLIATPGMGQQSLVGAYKVISHDVLVDGTALQPVGKAPHGYVMLTPTRYVAFYTSDNRKFGTSEADKAALLDTLAAWSGTYRIDGDKIIIAVDASWTEVWNGKDQVRHWALSGNRLTLTGDPSPFPRDPSKTAVVRLVCEKIE
jgi:Lipocalin-like domain